jgi:hypothetical protein
MNCDVFLFYLISSVGLTLQGIQIDSTSVDNSCESNTFTQN